MPACRPGSICLCGSHHQSGHRSAALPSQLSEQRLPWLRMISGQKLRFSRKSLAGCYRISDCAGGPQRPGGKIQLSRLLVMFGVHACSLKQCKSAFNPTIAAETTLVSGLSTACITQHNQVCLSRLNYI